MKPRNIAVTPGELAIAWSDGHESFYPFPALRRACPCATCRESRPSPGSSSSGLTLLQGPPVGQLRIEELRPVGAYAVQIVWSDGHDSGIYAFDRLRATCPCGKCR